MQGKEWARTWHHARLDIELLQGFYVDHTFPRHSHDYYVICLVERGFQSFTHQGTKHFTPPGGVILINPGAVHTGEAADEQGFEMLCLYPTLSHMQTALDELTGSHHALPFFADVRVDHPWAADSIRVLHRALTRDAGALECESRFTWTLAQLVKRFADTHPDEPKLGTERKAIRQACRYIEERFAEGISLTQLAEQVSLSPYYLLRVFRAQVGMPPYAYLESVRIRQAQRLIEAGKPLAEVAVEVGFSSQSHLTHRFKRIIGVTPGQYAQQPR
jgi:AraC-like DNA-binding protein